MKKLKPWRRTKRRRTHPHDRNEIGTSEKEHNQKETNNKVNTQHRVMAWCSTKYDAWKRLYDATHGKRWSIQEYHIKASLNEAGNTTYNKSGKSPYANFEIDSDLNKSYVQVVKQQVKMHQDDLHEILVKLHIKFFSSELRRRRYEQNKLTMALMQNTFKHQANTLKT